MLYPTLVLLNPIKPYYAQVLLSPTWSIKVNCNKLRTVTEDLSYVGEKITA